MSPQPPLPCLPTPVTSASFLGFTVVQIQVDLWTERMGCLGARLQAWAAAVSGPLGCS